MTAFGSRIAGEFGRLQRFASGRRACHKARASRLYLDKLLSLKSVYRGLAHEDEMVALFNHCTFNLNPRATSIDTPLRGPQAFTHIWRFKMIISSSTDYCEASPIERDTEPRGRMRRAESPYRAPLSSKN